MFKRLMLVVGVVIFAGSLWGAESSGPVASFWGTVTAINPSQQSLTLHNKKRKQDLEFQWNENTQVTNQKQVIPAESLVVGQFLKVAYVQNLGRNVAQSISIRTLPSRKKN